MRDVPNRYKGLPERPATLLFQVVRKFYRGAVNHYPFIQEKKQEVLQAQKVYRISGDREPLVKALEVLFLEFHFYLTCWLQIDLALYRLAGGEQGEVFAPIREAFGSVLEEHLYVRSRLDDTWQCVQAQFVRCGTEMACVEEDRYWFDEACFTVNQESLDSLHQLYEAIMANRPAI